MLALLSRKLILVYSFILIFLFVFVTLHADEIDSTVFVITAHVRKKEENNLWKRCYKSIRSIYPDAPIVLIDDNSSKPIAIDNPFCFRKISIIRSKYPGAGELLPYYYFLKHKWAPRMVFLHDSMFLNRPFIAGELERPLKFHWCFEDHSYDDDPKIDFLLSHLKNSDELIAFNESKSLWSGCFGVATVIDLEVLERIEAKYSFTSSLVNIINNRALRMALERVFAILVFKEGYVTKNDCANFGSIYSYPNAFKTVSSEELQELKSSYSGAILKTWHGR